MNIRGKQITTSFGMALVVMALGGCGDGLSKTSLGKIVEDEILSGSTARCWRLQNMNFEWPVTVGFGFATPAQEPILAAAAAAGMLDLRRDHSAFMGNRYHIDLTEKGRNAKVWDAEKGLCIGRPGLHEILRWTEPGQGATQTLTEVTFTWKLQEVPSWVEPQNLADIRGMAQPVESSLTLVKTNEGWRGTKDGLVNME